MSALPAYSDRGRPIARPELPMEARRERQLDEHSQRAVAEFLRAMQSRGVHPPIMRPSSLSPSFSHFPAPFPRGAALICVGKVGAARQPLLPVYETLRIRCPPKIDD
jgi:hypothetical protein